MNDNLVERFGRSRQAARHSTEQVHIWVLPPRLNLKIREYFDEQMKGQANGRSWLGRAEVPTSEEVLDIDPNQPLSVSDIVEIEPNRPQGAWESKDQYLSVHYELLREDAIRPLRDAVTRIRITPTATEASFNARIGIYEKVHICGITCSTRGIAIRVTFSLGRVGKLILWEQSKRLISGGLVVLTPSDDMFKKKAIVATVAARPLSGLQRNPPEIDLFIARAEEQELDPAVEYVMVEDRHSLYEASRHTLKALQKMMTESFPLSEHFIHAQRTVGPPDYVKQQPNADLTTVLWNNKHEPYENVDMLKGWPAQPHSDMDASQLSALHRMLTKRLALVQGPPGTGKTYVTVQAVKIMLANHKSVDPPIIIACQTNHAIDQMLRHIAGFEPNFIRLGGRSKDKEVVKPRTLYEVRKQTSQSPLPGSRGQNARKKMRAMEKEFENLLLPLKPGSLPLNHRVLHSLGLLTQQQADSLEAGASDWVQTGLIDPNEARSPWSLYLGDKLVQVAPKMEAEDHGFEYEEADLEFEQLKEIEAENAADQDADQEGLVGMWFPIADNHTCRPSPVSNAKVREALKEQSMWNIEKAIRPSIYRYLQAEAKKLFASSFRDIAKTFNEHSCVAMQIGRFEEQEALIRANDTKIIGLTTTGLSKYRGLVASLEPKIVIIEEAAETLEASVAVACMPSVQHLILVGDHKQLRPHCNFKEHEDKPYYLNVSLFERLVRNQVEFSTLKKQRRMIPEVRRLLQPIYGNLIQDHASVLDPANRPNVPGMGGVNSFFFTHHWPESRDEMTRSAYNPEEAHMVAGFVEYLVYNSVQPEEITVLTFYNGQRKRILKELRERDTLKIHRFKVVTVDSYQGEENKIVLLSLVRSNDSGKIGFLDDTNRVCVAVSRAKCGFYIFGNGELLFDHMIWWKVLNILANQGQETADHLRLEPTRRVGEALPLRCGNHNNETNISDPADFFEIVGGCKLKCDGTLPCGHSCGQSCHPFSHEYVDCPQLCGKELPTCSCGCVPCTCDFDDNESGLTEVTDGQDAGSAMPKPASTADSWNSYAEDESARYAVALSSQGTSPEQHTVEATLIDTSSGDHLIEGLDQLTGTPSGLAMRQRIAPLVVGMEDLAVDGGTRTKRKALSASSVTTAVTNYWSKEASLLD